MERQEWKEVEWRRRERVRVMPKGDEDARNDESKVRRVEREDPFFW